MGTSAQESDAVSVQRHSKRRQSWRNLAPPVTRLLAEQILERVVPMLQARGFRGAGTYLGDPGQSVSGAELHFDRRVADMIDSITFNFEKNRRPSVQVHISRRIAAPPHDFIRSGNLVARPWQYYHFWGKPWWCPTRFWPRRLVVITAEMIVKRLPQAVQFLEEGERGRNISMEVRSTGLFKRPRDDV
jgi:hypothetical protein